MKRIINGKTCNTETATRVAEDNYRGKEYGIEKEVSEALYLTRDGAFFLLVSMSWPGGSEEAMVPMDYGHIKEWLEVAKNAQILDSEVLADPAKAAEHPAATVYVRMSRVLKDRIEAQAKVEGVSLNAWVMRCCEKGLGGAA